MIGVVFACLLAAADPVGLVQGAPAPFDGVLVDADRISDLIEAEATAEALAKQLEVEKSISAEWKALATSTERPWWEEPELNRWVGFGAGVVVAVAAVLAGAWIVGLADDVASPPS